MKIGIIGLGNFGTALAANLAKAGNEVLAWTIEKEVVESVNSNHVNCKFFNKTILPKNLSATTKFEDLINLPIILSVLPAEALASLQAKFKSLQASTIVSCTKGLAGKSLITPLKFFETILGKNAKLAVISGPSFAIDIINDKPTALTLASKDIDLATTLINQLSTQTLRLYANHDTCGVELGGILKNVIAIAAGICDGLELGASARAGLITRGLSEMTRFAKSQGAQAETLFGLSGLGDLVLTATTDTSRNRTVGLRLAKGERLDNIMGTLNSVAEGVRTAPMILELAKQKNIDMPITEQVSLVLKDEISLDQVVVNLFTRPKKLELD